jgi:hypothetical protein
MPKKLSEAVKTKSEGLGSQLRSCTFRKSDPKCPSPVVFAMSVLYDKVCRPCEILNMSFEFVLKNRPIRIMHPTYLLVPLLFSTYREPGCVIPQIYRRE